MTLNTILKISSLFFLAGLCEIGGGYLMWIWIKEGGSFWLGLTGAFLLALYGYIVTFQPAHFSRIYAAYGGVFIAMSLLWGWTISGHPPDRYDLIGAAFCVIGVSFIMFGPRQV